MKKCNIPGCDRAHRARGWCTRHYERWKRHGDPMAVFVGPRVRWIREHVNFSGDDCLLPPFSVGKRADVRVEGRRLMASRYMAILVYGEPSDPSLYACHTCRGGTVGCVNPRHLYWGTPAQNSMDKLRDGTHNRGSRQWRAKLTESDVLEIRQAARNGETHTSIAGRYGLARSTVSQIVRRKRWAWLDDHEMKDAAE